MTDIAPLEKVIRDGDVAVLISPGYGAGWSTWGSPADILAMDRVFVEARERNATTKEIEAIAKMRLDDDHVYCGGWDDVKIAWIPVGTRFTIEVYDGSESLRTYDDLSMTA